MRPTIALTFALALAAGPLFAQSLLLEPAGKPTASSKTPAAVSYLFPEQITVPAGKATNVDLHFKVGAGLHINSNKPSEEELIPTTLKLPETSGVRLSDATFPSGTDFVFPLNPKEKLSVYTGEFTVHAKVVAERGEHLVEGTLRYQACNNEQCMPPHSIPVVFDVIAR